MSALVKVFVVFIFVLSVAFFGTTATLFKTRKDWRSAYNSLEEATRKGLDEVRTKNEELHGTISSMEKTIIGLKAQQDELGKSNKALVEDLSEEKKKVAGESAKAGKANDVAQQLAKNLEAEKTSYTQLQETLNKSKTDLDSAIALKAKSDSERDSFRLDLDKTQEELHVLRTRHKELSDKYDSLEIIMVQAKRLLGENWALATSAPRPIDGMVKAVDAKEKLVVLSVGKDQKVELGYEFTVYRGGEFIG